MKMKVGTCIRGNHIFEDLENAHMYGHWYGTTCNIGFCPRAWEMISGRYCCRGLP